MQNRLSLRAYYYYVKFLFGNLMKIVVSLMCTKEEHNAWKYNYNLENYNNWSYVFGIKPSMSYVLEILILCDLFHFWAEFNRSSSSFSKRASERASERMHRVSNTIFSTLTIYIQGSINAADRDGLQKCNFYALYFAQQNSIIYG